MDKTPEQLFNCDSLDDVPANCQKQLRLKINRGRDKQLEQKILSLFLLKNPLTLNELILGLYRQYNVTGPRVYFYNYLENLIIERKIKKILTQNPRLYELIKKDDHEHINEL